MPIYTPGNVTTAASNVYVSSGNTAVMWLSLCNYTASNVQANIYVVPSGGTPGNLNCVVANITIQGGDTYQIYAANERLLLGNGDSIQANAGSNNSITAICSYSSY